jgi:hypothetical protein
MAEDRARIERHAVKARARVSGDLRSALTEFAPALRCHYPGQAGVLKADFKIHSVILLLPRGEFLLRGNRLLSVDLGYMRTVL